jgi:hypothetical protein
MFNIRRALRLLLAAASIPFLSACAIGPVVSHETARTVGDGNSELMGGLGQAGYVFKWNHGLTPNLDMGVHWEMLSIGLRLKYAFINSGRHGWSLAGAAGIGSSVGGSHYYGDAIASYLAGSWEPYGTLRLVHVKNDPQEFKDKDTGSVEFRIDKTEYEYGQFILGTRYWFSPHWLLSLEATSFFTVSSGVHIGNGVLAGFALGYRF